MYKFVSARVSVSVRTYVQHLSLGCAILPLTFVPSHDLTSAAEYAERREILDVLRPANRYGSYQGENKRIPTASENLSLFNTHSTVKD